MRTTTLFLIAALVVTPVHAQPMFSKPSALKPIAPPAANTVPLEVQLSDVNKEIDALKDKKDSNSGLDEKDSLQLNLLADRKARLLKALSDVTKKHDDTANILTRNMKP